MFRIVLTVVFISLATVIIVIFIADLNFNLAQKSEKNYLWQKAIAQYDLAVKLDPFNSEYLAGLAKFLYDIGPYHTDKILYLQRAESLYNSAIKLNPENAGYYLGLGKVQLAEGKSGLDNFKKAVENDPNGFFISYAVGYTGMGMWKDLNSKDREFILDRLKKVLELRPRLSKYIYPRVLKITQDLKVLQEITARDYKAQKILYDFVMKNMKDNK